MLGGVAVEPGQPPLLLRARRPVGAAQPGAEAEQRTLGRTPGVAPLIEALRAAAAASYSSTSSPPTGSCSRASPGRPTTSRWGCPSPASATGLERLAELFWAAGAKSVLLPLARMPELRRGESLPELRPSDLKLMAFRPLGTARMDGRRGHGVLHGNGRVHGTERVYVCDGSAVPSSLGVNPQITIMTLATRLAHHLCHS